MSVMIDMNRGFDNVANIQNQIRNYEIREKKLKNIINNLNKNKELFDALGEAYAQVCSARGEFYSYKESFWYKFLGFLPQVKHGFNAVDDKYEDSLDRFNCELARRNIADEEAYHVRSKNFNRHYSRIDEFKEKLNETEKEKNDLVGVLKKLNVRVLDEYLSGLPGEVLSVVKSLPSEQVLVLKDLNLPRIDYKSLSMLYNEYSLTLTNLKNKYARASCNLVNFSDVSRAISLYKRACLNHNVLSAADGKMLVNKVKSFMLKHNIRNIDEVHEKQLKLKKEIEDTLQKMDDISTKKAKILPLLDVFKNNVQECGKKFDCKKSFVVQ